MSVEPVELATLDEDGLAREPTPLVFIEGWAAGTSAKIFNGLDDLLNERKPPAAQSRRMLVIKCGCYSSLWDRAIEIYYALKGGRCDYGEAHSREHGHARYGKTHAEGLYINWSESYPLHFAGHSFGGVTIFYLQQMLGTVLPGSATMMKSIVTISSPLRGTPLAAAFGQLEGSGGQKRFSLGWFMSLSIYIANAAKVIAPDLYDFGGDHWTSTDEKERDAKYGMVESFSQYLTGRSVGLNADSAAYDMLPSSMSQHNEGAALTEHTFYRSCVAFQVAEMLYFPPLAYCQRIIASSASTDYPGDPDWATSDGVIPSKSQMHPGDCHETTCLHIPAEIEPEDEPPPVAGVWHVKTYEDTTHFGLVDYLWKIRASSKTRLFWNDLGEWLRRVDEAVEPKSQEAVKSFAVSIVDS